MIRVSVVNATAYREVTAGADVAVTLPVGRYAMTVTGADVYYTSAAAVVTAGATRSAIALNGAVVFLSHHENPLRLRTAAGVADVHISSVA